MGKFKGLLIVALVVVVAGWLYWAHKNSRKPDGFYMEMAIEAAKNHPGSPFGSVIVDNKTGEVLAAGYNMTGESPTYHSEIVAINNCAKKYPRLDWKNTTLYTTAQPNAMAQAAIELAGISKVVYGTTREYLKDHGWVQTDTMPEEIGGVLHEKTDPMFNKTSPVIDAS